MESGALPGLMLDLGLLKISLGEFFLCLSPTGLLPNPAGQSQPLLNLTCSKISSIYYFQ